MKRRSERITCEHPQTAAIGRHVGIERNLHREISNGGDFRPWLHIKKIALEMFRHPNSAESENSFPALEQPGKDHEVSGEHLSGESCGGDSTSMSTL